jgi:septum formation protein
VPFEVLPANIDETPLPRERALDLVRRLALAKAQAVAGDPVLGADTIVELDGQLLGQPADADHARRILRLLSGRTHRVHTGVALVADGHHVVETATTLVTFVPVTPGLLEWYLATGEPFGKAGAYAIQGVGGVLVEKVNGSVSNIVGLPLTVVARLLIQSGLWDPRVSAAPSGPQALG